MRDADSETAPANPARLEIVIVDVPVLPLESVRANGFAEIAKSAGVENVAPRAFSGLGLPPFARVMQVPETLVGDVQPV
jgi:hypothetical protein